MTTYIIKKDLKVKIRYLNYDQENHVGLGGSFVDTTHSTDTNDLYDILVINGYSSKLIEGCVNDSVEGDRYSFRAIRVRDL